MPRALYALMVGAFGIGVTEFVIMGLLLEVSTDLGVSLSAAGLLISGYALGVVAGAPLLTALTAGLSRKSVLLALMAIFTIGNAACAIAPDYGLLMAARVLTAFAHGTFFGVGSVVAAGLVAKDRQASAIAIMFTGLTLANIVGVPLGTWLGQQLGWRATFWAVSIVGLLAIAVIARFVPHAPAPGRHADWRTDFAAMARPAVLLGFATTTLGFSGVFAVFTYIAPLLTRVTGFAEPALSPLLLVLGAGLIAGNLLGGRLADRALVPALAGTILALCAVLASMSFLLTSQPGAVLAIALLGTSGFATVPPLQLWVMQRAQGASQSLASSFNIAAFNLGNALGAGLAGLALDSGMPLQVLPLFASLLPLLGFAFALAALRAGRSAAREFPAA